LDGKKFLPLLEGICLRPRTCRGSRVFICPTHSHFLNEEKRRVCVWAFRLCGLLSVVRSSLLSSEGTLRTTQPAQASGTRLLQVCGGAQHRRSRSGRPSDRTPNTHFFSRSSQKRKRAEKKFSEFFSPLGGGVP
jgi:hypothetical protein